VNAAVAAPAPFLPTDLADLCTPLQHDGFAFVAAAAMRAVLQAHGLERWSEFAASWDELGLDTYMADGGRYRRRRHGAYGVGADGIVRKPRQPHYQSRDYNPLNGGIERWFEPITEAMALHPALLAVLRTGQRIFDCLTPVAVRPPAWHVEVHQFRVQAQMAQAGLPTPEGVHRDGVDWVLVLLVARHGVKSGVTTIHDGQRRPIGRFVLTDPFDTALVDDARVFHGVTPITPLDAHLEGRRDVLVVTFRR